MFTLIVGGSASGKSEYAERHVLSLDGPRVYIATMEPADAECRARIARHRAARKGRGFQTLECCMGLDSLAVPPGSNVLLEDLGNLTANELFRENGSADRILNGVEHLLRSCRHLTVVGNEVFSGGSEYDAETIRYINVLTRLQRQLARRADRAVEVICGLPVYLKEEKHDGV